MPSFNNDLQRVYTNQIHKPPVRVNRKDEGTPAQVISKEVAAAVGPLLAMVQNLQAQLFELQAQQKPKRESKQKDHEG